MGSTPALIKESASKSSFHLFKHKGELHAVFWHIVGVQEAVKFEVEFPGQVTHLGGSSQPTERSQRDSESETGDGP